MQKVFSVIGILAVLCMVAFFEGKDKTIHGGVPIFDEDEGKEREVDVFEQKEEAHAFSSLEYQLEEIREKDGYTIEVYREVEIYRDENGTIIKTNPTDHYNYLRYENPEDTLTTK